MSSDKKVEFKPKFDDTLLYAHHTTSLVFNDPPSHTRVRKLIAAGFTPRAIAALEPSIEAVVARALNRAQDVGELDIIGDFALIVPTEVIGDMLGVPVEIKPLLRGWSLKILAALEPVTPPEVLDAGDRAVGEFCDFLRQLIAERRGRSGRSAGGADIRRGRWRTPERAGTAAQLHFHTQCRPRDHDQPRRQRCPYLAFQS
jgi:cytochrome P450